MCRPDSQACVGCAERGREELVRRHLDGRVRTEAFGALCWIPRSLRAGGWGPVYYYYTPVCENEYNYIICRLCFLLLVMILCCGKDAG
jgi:hypothetical protein